LNKQGVKENDPKHAEQEKELEKTIALNDAYNYFDILLNNQFMDQKTFDDRKDSYTTNHYKDVLTIAGLENSPFVYGADTYRPQPKLLAEVVNAMNNEIASGVDPQASLSDNSRARNNEFTKGTGSGVAGRFIGAGIQSGDDNAYSEILNEGAAGIFMDIKGDRNVKISEKQLGDIRDNISVTKKFGEGLRLVYTDPEYTGDPEGKPTSIYNVITHGNEAYIQEVKDDKNGNTVITGKPIKIGNIKFSDKTPVPPYVPPVSKGKK
jgi:hypothetical protein